MSWVFVAKLDEIPPRGARVLRVGLRSIGVFRTSSDEVFALLDSCPHQSGPLSQGIVHGHCVTCPLHDWVIDLRNGQATGPDEGVTRSFPVTVDSGSVFVNVTGVADSSEEAAAELAAVGQ